MWGAWATGMAAADAAILQRFERLGMGSIKPAAGLVALAAILSAPMPDAQARNHFMIVNQPIWPIAERRVPCCATSIMPVR